MTLTNQSSQRLRIMILTLVLLSILGLGSIHAQKSMNSAMPTATSTELGPSAEASPHGIASNATQSTAQIDPRP